MIQMSYFLFLFNNVDKITYTFWKLRNNQNSWDFVILTLLL